MRFASPHWLWFSLAAPLGYLLLLWSEKHRHLLLGRFASREVWSLIIPELDPGARPRKARFWLAALLFALLAMARPQWGMHEEVTRVAGLDIMLVLDVSSSMEVEDVMPSRLKKAKHIIRTFIGRLQGDRIGIVPFAASSYVACPLTTDLEYVLEQIEMLSPRSIVNQGTDIGLGLETALASLTRGAEEGAATPSEKVMSQGVVLISDGEDHEERALELARKMQAAGIRLYVIGVGSQKGGPIPVRDESGSLHGYKREGKGEAIVSTFRPDELMQIATAAGGRYWNATASEAEVEELVRELGGLNRTDYAERRHVTYEEHYQWPLGLAFLFFLLELGVPLRKKGARTSVIPALLGLLFLTQTGCVSPLDNYRENEKGIQALREGKTAEAKQSFGSVQARNPELSELGFNQAIAQMKEGDEEGALRNFAEAAKSALKKGDPKVAGQALFNLGSVFTKKGDVASAVQSYLGAIEEARKNKDTALEQDARKNLELILPQVQKQKQKQKQKQEQQKKQDQEKKDQEKKDEKKGQGEEQNKKFEDPSKSRQKFKSQKLSDEDAERVMAELKSRERDLQGKLKRQNVKPSGKRRDW